uniref:Uncharacterized protein n=1 Tax=Rhizophora mucronata TaxID=61149 RepID=A0A2P2QNX3_RHIMU
MMEYKMFCMPLLSLAIKCIYVISSPIFIIASHGLELFSWKKIKEKCFPLVATWLVL